MVDNRAGQDPAKAAGRVGIAIGKRAVMLPVINDYLISGRVVGLDEDCIHIACADGLGSPFLACVGEANAGLASSVTMAVPNTAAPPSR